MESKSFLVIINGAPGTGKTTLARRLARDLGLLLISKDDLKEILFDILGSQDRAWSQKLGQASFKLLFHLLECQLRAGGSAIVETAFIPQFDTPRFLQLKQQYGFEPFQILCTTEEQTLVERFLHRARSGERHPGHLDRQVTGEQVRETLRSDKYGVLEIGGTVFELDTTDFERMDYKGLLEAIVSAQEGGSLITWPGIEKTPEVVGGAARIVRTRIPVWVLVNWRRLGWNEAKILENYPTLRAVDLVNAWAYADAHQEEIEKEILENEAI